MLQIARKWVPDISPSKHIQEPTATYISYREKYFHVLTFCVKLKVTIMYVGQLKQVRLKLKERENKSEYL